MAINYDKLASANSEGAITAAIKSLHLRDAKHSMDIHRVLVAICERWKTSGDMRPVAGHINHLLDKTQLIGKRKNAIRKWVEVHMKLALVEEGENKGLFYVPKDKHSGKHLDMSKLTNERWHEMTPEPKYTPIDDDMKLVKALLAKLKNDRAKLGDASKVNPATIAALAAIGKNTGDTVPAHIM